MQRTRYNYNDVILKQDVLFLWLVATGYAVSSHENEV